MQLQEAIKKRKSVKKFSSKAPDWRKVIRCIDVARLGPLAGNVQAINFILVRDEETIEKAKAASQQDFVGQAKMLIVVVSDREKVRKLYDLNNKGFAAQQAGAAIQNLLLALTEEKIDHCWVGFFDDRTMSEAFGVPEDKVIEAIIPVGFSPKNIKNKQKEKPALENIIYFDQWDNNSMEPQTKINRANF